MEELKNVTGFVLVCLLLLFHSCKNEDIKDPCKLENVETPFVVSCKLSKNIDSVKMYIHGTWTWLQEARPIRELQTTKYLTPKTEGYSLELKLHGDTATYYKCNKVDAVYKFAIVKLKEISGTNFPEDENPVLVYYDLNTGLRHTHVPIVICKNYCILQYEDVSSFVGPFTWKKISN